MARWDSMPSPAWPGLELEDVHAVQPLHVPLGDPPDEGDEVEDPISTRGASKRRRVKEDEELMLRSFLSQYGFEDVNAPQKPNWFHAQLAFCGEREELYPLHMAAKLGRPQLVKLLLRAGADKEKETSQGRSAWEVAVAEGHEEVIHILEGTELLIKETWSAKDLLRAAPPRLN